MNNTTSIAFPNMFDVSHNRLSVYEGNRSIVNRTRLLILTDPTELYNSPEFGVGISRYLWQYHTANTRAMVEDRIKEQLRAYEPCVDAELTAFSNQLLFSEDQDRLDTVEDNLNHFKMTVGLSTIYEDKVDVILDLQNENHKLYADRED